MFEHFLCLMQQLCFLSKAYLNVSYRKDASQFAHCILYQFLVNTNSGFGKVVMEKRSFSKVN